jgi:hypothetical protein
MMDLLMYTDLEDHIERNVDLNDENVKKADWKALALIRSSVSEAVLQCIMGKDTPKAAPVTAVRETSRKAAWRAASFVARMLMMTDLQGKYLIRKRINLY